MLLYLVVDDGGTKRSTCPATAALLARFGERHAPLDYFKGTGMFIM